MDADLAKAAVALSYVIMIVFNGLTFTGAFGKGIGEISFENPTWVTPDGRTFAVWGIIYTLHLLLVIRQCNPCAEDEHLFARGCPLTGLPVRWRIVLAFICNAAWLPAWSSERFSLALLIIVAYLGMLLSTYLTLNPRTTTANFRQWSRLAAPIAANASWLVVATAANVFTVGRQLGWQDEFGVGGSVQAGALVSVLVAVLASWLAISLGDVAWGSVAAWALAGIYRMQTVPNETAFPPEAMSPLLANVAGICCIIAAVTALFGVYVLSKYQSANPGHSLLPQPVPY